VSRTRAQEQSHCARRVDPTAQPSLGFSWYTGTAFPADYRGDMFVAEHGSWNRANRSGAEVIRIPIDEKGKANGVYQTSSPDSPTPKAISGAVPRAPPLVPTERSM